MPAERISRATWSRPTVSPSRISWACTRAVAVALVVRLVHLADPAGQPLVLDPARRPLAGRALVVRGRRHVQGLTDRLDAEARAMHVDERAHLVRSASSSVAKNTDAAFRISFARRSSKILLAELLDLLALLAGGQIRPQAAVGLGLTNPLTQRLVTDTQIARDLPLPAGPTRAPAGRRARSAPLDTSWLWA